MGFRRLFLSGFSAPQREEELWQRSGWFGAAGEGGTGQWGGPGPDDGDIEG